METQVSDNKKEEVNTKEEVAVPADVPEPMDPEIEAMFNAGVHYGYSRTKRHPKMAPYIFGSRNGAEIFDLEKTKICLAEAEAFLKEQGKKNVLVLYVGTKPSISHLVVQYAAEAGLPYFANRWIGGFITNFSEIKKRIERFKEILLKKNSGELLKLPKKAKSDIEREFKALEENFGGVKEMKDLPGCLFIIDAKEELTAVREARRKKIPVVAIMSTDNDPEDAMIMIPANDNAPKSVEFLLSRLTNAYIEGKKEGAALVPASEKKEEADAAKKEISKS
jgi:small subunit ribosomal protein S2